MAFEHDPFDDANLKTLKQACWNDPDGKIKGRAADFLSLIQRLEASEVLAAYAAEFRGNDSPAVRAWLKSCGK